MTTPAQLAANRRNARKSTGPASAEGKAAAAQNAMKHGLHAQDVVCGDEESGEYQAFAETLYADLAPTDSVEAALVDRIATLTWRLQRMVYTEKSIFNSWHSTSIGHDPLRPGQTVCSLRFLRSTSEMQALSRYEASLDRALSRAFALLDRRQARRRGEYVPAPISVVVEGHENSGPGDSANALADKADFENCETNPIFATVLPIPAG